MFIGHFGVALAAKKVAPRASLGTLILAAQFLDFLWPLFLLLGIEHVKIAPGIFVASPLEFTDYPISHSLLMALVWALLFGGTYYMQRGYARGTWVVAAAVLSHWVLDFIVHRPDLPLLPGGRLRAGLGLWNFFLGSIAVEALFFGAGLGIYLSCTRARDRVGRYGFWSLIAFSFFRLDRHSFGRRSSERGFDWLGWPRDVVDGSLGWLGRPASRNCLLASVSSLHLVFHAVGQLFYLLRLLHHIHGQRALVGLVHRLLEFTREFEQFLRVTLEIGLASLVGLLGHISFHPDARLVFATGFLLEWRDLGKLQRITLGRGRQSGREQENESQS